jgi:hypothetical protein
MVSFLAGFEVPTELVMKNTIFWDMTSCNPLKANRRFGGTYRLHFDFEKVSREIYQDESNLLAICFHAGVLLDLSSTLKMEPYFLPKRRMVFNGQKGVISKKILLFVLWILLAEYTGTISITVIKQHKMNLLFH